ncbi:MAG: hypothetical protein JOY60_06825 [Burkholderiaceae bacterium]|nr:hypothetical protein [Roseateles sp.]MBV8469558.1 hypothetical protein [Burkholderiaceae bacterium]
MSAFTSASPAGRFAHEGSIFQCIARLYAEAQMDERAHIVELLLRPIGALSLIGVAGGLFAKIRFKAPWENARIAARDIELIKPEDVLELAIQAEEIEPNILVRLLDMVDASPRLSDLPSAADIAKFKAHGKPGGQLGAGR